MELDARDALTSSCRIPSVSCRIHAPDITRVPDIAVVKKPNPVTSLDCLVKYHLTYSIDITKLNNVKLFKLFIF